MVENDFSSRFIFLSKLKIKIKILDQFNTPAVSESHELVTREGK